MSTIIQKHRGRVVDSPGDNLLAEFLSVVDAVRCAVEIQEELRIRNAELPKNRMMKIRIGINLGDVVEEGERIYGDGVNITARVEGLAEGGGICISGTVYDSIKNKLSLGYESLGEHTVKNIKDPVRVYRMRVGPDAAALGVSKEKKLAVKRWQWAVLAGMVVVILGAVAVWNFYFRLPSIEPASVERMAFPLPDKPSIAVLPFVNMSGDPEQEYFSDGMTEDLITNLSQVSGLFVIGRNSTFTYKEKPVNIRQVAEELGVRYVLKGSVRKAENMMRINAQLIDATTGGHLWAESYDEQMDNIFSLQDKITQKIVEALAVKLTIDEKEVIPKKETDNLEAYLTFLKGWQHYRRFTPDAFLEAIPLLEKAIELDPNYWRAYAVLAKIYLVVYKRTVWQKSMGLRRDEASHWRLEYLEIAMKGPTPLAYEVAVETHIDAGEFQEAITEAERAVSLDSNDPDSHFAMGVALTTAGRHSEAVDSFKRAMRLDPFYQDTLAYGLGIAYFFLFEFEKAANLFERSFKSNPQNYVPLWFLTAAYAHLGRQREAEAAFAKLRELNPQYSYLSSLKYFMNFNNPANLKLLADGLEKAGMR
jgi:TolB-like protein/Flp pilus assembly protein TadD